MQEKLARSIDKEAHSKICSKSKSQTPKDTKSNIARKKLLAIFEVEGKRGANQYCCYQNFISIPPSVDSERVLSSSEDLSEQHSKYVQHGWICVPQCVSNRQNQFIQSFILKQIFFLGFSKPLPFLYKMTNL
jgi:hypothetical protein